MKSSLIIEMPGIGPVLFEHSQRARRLNITVRPVKGVRVAVPRGVSFTEARLFVSSKGTWIEKHLADIRAMKEQVEPVADLGPGIGRNGARKLLLDRLAVLAKTHGFIYNKVTLRNQRTRWGSCSARNTISLNMKLVRLPEDLIDYVILHELAHTRVKNHGPDFWSLLDSLVGDAKDLQARLRNYSALLPA
ncbi:MAG: M48 family metallopeptidase [Deltaproteobacteria bacterium]|nr:M48 family metallopeptidase [Deltaproteobacteria bacterium]